MRSFYSIKALPFDRFLVPIFADDPEIPGRFTVETIDTIHAKIQTCRQKKNSPRLRWDRFERDRSRHWPKRDIDKSEGVELEATM